MLRTPVRLYAKLRTRLLAWGASSPGEPVVLKLRRTGSLLLVLAGTGLIAITLASQGGSAQVDEAEPASEALIQLDGDTSPPAAPVKNDAPARVEAPLTQSLANPTGASLSVSVRRSYPLIWPAEGPLTSEMGPWHTLGIDIGLDYDVDSPIYASARGEVVFAGGEEWETYGHHVILDHDGDLRTLYGHLYELFVEEGDVVEQGDLLGYGGDTGVADGKHLHFEVRHGQALIDPEHVLPPYLDDDPPEPLAADCGEEAIVIESGAPLLVDFREALGAASISGVTVEKVRVSGEALPVVASVETATTVLFDSTPTTGLTSLSKSE